jgi:predicted deacylase
MRPTRSSSTRRRPAASPCPTRAPWKDWRGGWASALSSELGGGGRATPQSLAVAERGLSNLLAHIGVRDGSAPRPSAAPRSQLVALSRPEHHVPAPATGRLAPRVWLGDRVRRGDVLGRIHPLEDPLAAPVPVRALSDGVVVAAASRGLQREGAALFYVAEPIARDARAG